MIHLELEVREQFRGLFESQCRWSVIVAHRRAGKTVACIQKLIIEAMQSNQVRPRYAYIAPLLKQAKAVAWDYLRAAANQIPGCEINNSELRIDLPNGAQVRLYGADNPDTLRGLRLDGCVLDEAADMASRLYPEVIRPALSDRLGWCVWIGTPKGLNAFFDTWEGAKEDPDWFSLMLKASETGLIKFDELKDAKKQMSDAQYAQEYECSFQAAVIGSYYGEMMVAVEEEGRIAPHLYDPALEVHTAWDLGVGDDTVIIFYQQAANEIRIIDYYAANGWGLDHYARVLREKPYIYAGGNHFPHDVDIRTLAGGEIARTRKQTLEGLGVPVLIVPKWSLEDGINAVRRVFPRLWFDSDTTQPLIKACRLYRRDWDDVRKTFVERPRHDEYSHPADALRMLAISVADPVSKATKGTAPSYDWIL